MIKFGSKVLITEKGFYNMTPGIVLYHNSFDDMYTILLDFGRTHEAYAYNVKEVKFKKPLKKKSKK